MFEGLVKRLLDTYLAPYVEGITQNLQMAVWSGNISLENLTLKEDITSRLSLPFHAMSGKIGRMNIRIPWASLGTTPIKIVIDSVYVCIDNRSNQKTDEEILAHIRKKKNNLISMLEHEYFELANLQSQGNLSSSYIIKLSQKILNNIQIDLTNIHLQFFDEHSSFSFKMDSIFVRKSRGDETNKSLRLKTNEGYREEPVTHVCSLLGLSIYETNFNIPKEEVSSKRILEIIINEGPEESEQVEDYIGLLMLEPLSFRLYLAINARNKSIYASLCIGSIKTNKSRLSRKVIDYTNILRNNINVLTNKNQKKEQEDKESKNEEEEDRLKVVLTSDVIRTFTKMWVDINTDRKRGKRILMSKQNEVKLDPESLKHSTKAEFIKLYTKYKQNKVDENAGKEMEKEELDRLQDLIDMVPARYIARWKFACKQRSSAQVVTKENKSWFKWAKNIVTTTYTNYQSNKQDQTKEEVNREKSEKGEEQKKTFRSSFFSLNKNSSYGLNKENKEKEMETVLGGAGEPNPKNGEENEDQDVKDGEERSEQSEKEEEDEVSHQVVVENLPGGLVLTEEEIKMIQETISLEELFEDSLTTSSYYFECVLPSFQFIIQLLSGGKTVIKDEEDIIVIDIQNLQSRLYMHAVMDMKDKDVYEGYFDLNLDSFDVILKDKKIMTFSQQNMPFQSIVDTYIDPFNQETYQTGTNMLEELESNEKRMDSIEHIGPGEKSIMNLRIYHKIKEKGNVIMVQGELKPIETNIFPELISVFFELMSLFKPIKIMLKEDLGLEGYSYKSIPSTLSIATGTSVTARESDQGTSREELEEDEIINKNNLGESKIKGENEQVKMKENERIYFINFDIKFSAPILILYHETSRIDLYFGTLLLKSNGDCPIGKVEGSLELKQTQVSVVHKDKSFNFLRPLPVKIHYDLDIKNEQISLNVIFEEIFAQLEPMATSILFKIPNEIIKIVTKNIMEERGQSPVVNREGVQEVGKYDTNVVNNKLKKYKICSNVLIRHSGFSVSNLALHEIFKLDMYNVSIKTSNALDVSNFSLSLESIIISNPTTKIPMFKTINELTNSVRYKYDDVTIQDLNIAEYAAESNSKPFTREQSRTNSLEFSKLRSAGESEEGEDEYVDAIEEVSNSLNLEVKTTLEDGGIYNQVDIFITEMEGNWEYSTVKLVADCFQEYNEIFSKNMNESSLTTLTTTLKTFKEKFMFSNTNIVNQQSQIRGNKDKEEESTPIIEGFLIKEELPVLEAEYKGLEVQSKYKLTIMGSSVLFSNANGDVIAKLSVGKIEYKLSKYINGEKIMKLTIQTGKLYFGGRCVLSHLISGSEEGPGDYSEDKMGKADCSEGNEEVKENNLLQLRLKSYRTSEVPYSMCFQGKVDRVVFVYFQHDVNRFLEYFDDGILSVFLSKSYHKVVQRAEEIYFFYHFSVTSPIFIFPENKATIPNCKEYYKQEIPPGSTLPLYNKKNREKGSDLENLEESEEDKELTHIAKAVDLWYFGSYVLFELGHLEFKNSYSKLVEKYKSTIFLQMLGTKAQIKEQKKGTRNVKGLFLDPTDLKVCTRGREVMEIGVDSKAVVTKLTRNQLTFLVDVFNENIGGAAYMLNKTGTTSFTQNFPTKNESRYLIRLSLDKLQFHCYNNVNKETSRKEEPVNGTDQEFEVTPVGFIEFKDITCCLDYASNNVQLLSYYQFGFISKSLKITDLRENSFNKYKTLLKCNNQNETNQEDLLEFEEEDEGREIRRRVNGLLFEWLKEYKNKTGNDFFKINAEYFENKGKPGEPREYGSSKDKSKNKNNIREEDGIKCVIASDPEESLIDVIVSNSEIPLLFVFFFDLVRFFSLSYGTSSMALFPKISQVNLERVYTLNLLVSKSKFIAFTKMDKLDCPRLELVSDFIVQMHVNGNSFKFTKMDIVDCVLSRVYPNTNIKQVLCGNFLMYGKGHYLSDISSKMFFQFTIPQINLHLYTRDLSIIIYCIKSMFTDGPSVIPVKLVNNQLIDDNSSKFLTLSFDVKGIEMLFFNDLKKSIIPLVKFTVESEKMEILNLPIEKRYSLIRCNCNLYYFNTNVGDWEPFIEKFIFNLEYITNPSGSNVTGSMKNRISNQINPNKANRPGDDNIWKDFVSEYQIKITCNNNLLLNITPNLCQLLQYFIPILKSNLLQSPYLNNPNNLDPTRGGQEQQDNGIIGKRNKEEEEEDLEMYNYRYINLTNHEYYGFIIDLSKSRKEAFSEVVTIVTTTKPKQIDSLVNQLNKEVTSNEYCIYLITKPPKNIVKNLAREFKCNEKLVENDLLATSSIIRTKSNLSNINQSMSNWSSSKEFNRNVLFNNGIVLSNVPLSKNCTVLLPIPVKDLNMFSMMNVEAETVENEEDEPDVLTSLMSINSNEESSSKTESNVNTNRTSSVSGTNDGTISTNRLKSEHSKKISMAQNNRITNVNSTIVNNNIICQVLSPHPSHKLLLFTSTVRIYNKSGLPIMMCFLDYSFKQQYMYNLNHRTIPCDLLYQNDMQNFKQYTSNNIQPMECEVYKGNEDAENEEMEGHYVVIPNDYMLSVPENVFLSESQVILSFKPMYVKKDLENKYNLLSLLKTNYGKEKPTKHDYSKLVNRSGWCKIIDSNHHVGTRVRQCYCPDVSKNGYLYFVVSVNNKRSSLPANVNISEIVIYPSISVMNTIPLDMDIKLLSKDYNIQGTKGQNRESHVREREDATFQLYKKSILHIYSVPPNESLALYIRLNNTGGGGEVGENRGTKAEDQVTSGWSSRIENIYGNNDSKSVFNIIVNSSVLELELIRFPGALPVNNLCIQGHLSLIINAPWLFIDRTGLKLVPQHINRIYTTNNLSFLYDNNNNNYKLISLNNPVQESRRNTISVDKYGNRYVTNTGRYVSGGTYRYDELMEENEYDIKMPIIGGYIYNTIEIKGKKHCVCLMTEKVYIPGLSHISSKITSAVPEYVFTNNLKEVVYLRRDPRTQSMQILPETTQSISHLTQTNYITKEQNMGESYKENHIEIKVGMETSWSNVIYLSEMYSGENFMSLCKENSSKSQVYNITIIPKNGIKYISINECISPSQSVLYNFEKSNETRGYLLYNNCSIIKVVMLRTFHKTDFRNGACFTAKYGQVIHFGWPNPFLHKSKLVQVLLWLDKNTVAPSKPLIFNFSTPSFRFRRIELTTPEYHTNHNITILAENRIDYFIIIINPNEYYLTTQVSKGREQEKADQEEIDDNILIRNTDNNIKDIKNEDLYEYEEDNMIKSYQVILNINQIGVSIVSQSMQEELFFMEMGGIMALFMCKEDHQRLELKVTDVQLDNQTELDMGKTILVNRSKVEVSDTSFLQVYVDRPFSNCKDISIKKMFVSLDDLQVDFNDLLFTKVYSYYKECLLSMMTNALNNSQGMGNYGGWETKLNSKIDIETIEKWLEMEKKRGTSSIDVNVKLPRSISIDYLYVDGFTLVVWCCFELDKLHMLGDLLRMGLRILSVSRNFELMGAPLTFQREYVTINRTSVISFYEQLKEKYLQSCLSCIGSILGYSNLLNIPKLPLTLGRCTIELAADAVDSVSSGLGLVLSKFTFDKEYMKRRSTAKEVTGIKDGLYSAGKTIGEGLFSLTNILTKPIEGAQKEGVGGFIKGLGKGLVGSIVKPIDKMGIAVSQVSRGIKANISKEEKFTVEGCRNPRMLWGEFAHIRPFSEEEAEIKKVLGSKYARHIMDCLLVMKQQTGRGGKQVALLLYPSRIYLVDLTQESASVSRRPYTIWKLQITNITDVRASSHGVIIKCGQEQFQVPCTRADMINNIHTAFQRAIKHASSQITIGPELFGCN